MKINAKDLAIRALHTFWQAFVGTLVVVWGAAGLDVSQLTSIDAAKKFAVAALAAVLAAALSAAKTTIASVGGNALPAEIKAALAANDTGAGFTPAPSPAAPAVPPAAPAPPA